MSKVVVEFEYSPGDIVVIKPTTHGNSTYYKEPKQYRVVTVIAEDMGGGGGFNKLYRCRKVDSDNYADEIGLVQFTETEVMHYEAYKVAQAMLSQDRGDKFVFYGGDNVNLAHEKQRMVMDLKTAKARLNIK